MAYMHDSSPTIGRRAALRVQQGDAIAEPIVVQDSMIRQAYSAPPLAVSAPPLHARAARSTKQREIPLTRFSAWCAIPLRYRTVRNVSYPFGERRPVTRDPQDPEVQPGQSLNY